MSYAAEHASAYADVAAAGAAVTFTRRTKSEAALTGVVTVTTTTVGGVAMQVQGDPRRYRELSLVVSTNPTLLFVPTTYGQVPESGDTVVWGGLTLTVKDVNALKPDGTVVLAKVIVG